MHSIFGTQVSVHLDNSSFMQLWIRYQCTRWHLNRYYTKSNYPRWICSLDKEELAVLPLSFWVGPFHVHEWMPICRGRWPFGHNATNVDERDAALWCRACFHWIEQVRSDSYYYFIPNSALGTITWTGQLVPSTCKPTLLVAPPASRTPPWSCFTEDALQSTWHTKFEMQFSPRCILLRVLWAKKPRIGLRQPLEQTKGWGWVYTRPFTLPFGFWTDTPQTNTQAFRNFLMTSGYCADSLIELYFRNNKGKSKEKLGFPAPTYATLLISTNTHPKGWIKERAIERSSRQAFHIRWYSNGKDCPRFAALARSPSIHGPESAGWRLQKVHPLQMARPGEWVYTPFYPVNTDPNFIRSPWLHSVHWRSSSMTTCL